MRTVRTILILGLSLGVVASGPVMASPSKFEPVALTNAQMDGATAAGKFNPPVYTSPHWAVAAVQKKHAAKLILAKSLIKKFQPMPAKKHVIVKPSAKSSAAASAVAIGNLTSVSIMVTTGLGKSSASAHAVSK